jgi:aldehyde dehydrogenase (NAD+)
MNPAAERSPSTAGSPDSILSTARAVYDRQRANRWKVAQTTADERAAKLRRLYDGIWARREEIEQAIQADFGKNPAETDLTEIYPCLAEIKHAIANLYQWMEPVPVETPLALFGTRSEIRYEPKGLVLILSPWNYPFNLLINPLVAAIAAGNCVIAKPSSKVPKTSAFLKKFLAEIFPEDEVAVFEGSPAVSDALLFLPFDHIFFTGSPKIGKTVMVAAARNLTPVTLELGGKSPVIVDASADIRKAAERILWGKFVNAGQTCVAPDYLLIHESRAAEFTAEARKVVARRYGETEEARRNSPDYCRLVSEGHLEGLKKVLEESLRQGAKVEFGGEARPGERFLSPTLLSNVREDSPIMREEIFGPILPMIAFKSLEEAFRIIRSRGKPLALYIFSKDDKAVERILRNTTAGGTCVNSVMVHLANPDLPFGGVGHSGMGSYHGVYGFRALSHERAVLRQGWFDSLKNFYPPYTAKVRNLIRWTMKLLG